VHGVLHLCEKLPKCEDLRKFKGNNLHKQCGTSNEMIVTKIVLLQLMNITPPIYGYSEKYIYKPCILSELAVQNYVYLFGMKVPTRFRL